MNAKPRRPGDHVVVRSMWGQRIQIAMPMTVIADAELERAVGLGLVTQAQADSFIAEGKRAVARLQARISPFADDWEMWIPDPAWPIPSLPPNWDRID